MSSRIAVAGAGVMGRAHAERIQQHPTCTLVGLADPTPSAKRVADQLAVPWFDGLASLLQNTQPDGIVLATPNALHVSGALSCIAAGVPVLIEKPIASSVADAQRVVDAARQAGVPVLVGHHRRHSPAMAQARDVIDGGRLGRLVAVSGSATFVKPKHYFSDAPWRAQAGGGPILINLVHDIDNLRMLMGEISAVHAMASHAVRGLAVEDTVAINLQFESGALGTFLLSDTAASPRSWEHTSGENKAYDHHADQDCYVVSGTQGSLQVPSLREYHYDGECSWLVPLSQQQHGVEVADPLCRQLDHFCAVIRQQASPRVTADSATRSLAVTLAVAQAAASGAVVRLT
jgi:predicted dehydrogenase